MSRPANTSWLLAVLASAGGQGACTVDIPALADDTGDASIEIGSDVAVEEHDEADVGADVRDEHDTGLETEADAQDSGCTGGFTDCDGDPSNGCEDVETDPDHCGACNHGCMGGTCIAGACQPFLLANGLQKASAFVKDPAFVFGISALGGRLWKVPIAGCAAPSTCPEFLTEPGGEYRGIAMDADAVYVSNQNRIERIPKDGGAGCLLATTQGKPQSVAVDDTYVYWAARLGGDGIWRKSKACGSAEPPVQLASTSVQPYLMTRDASGFYWSDLPPTGVYWTSLDGAQTTAVWSGALSSGDYVFAPATDGDWVYWREGFSNPTQGTGRVVRAPKSMSGATEILEDTQNAPRGVAVDDTHVYWTTAESVRRGTKDGESIEGIADGMQFPHWVLVDEQAVYFCTYVGGELFRLAK